MDEGPAVITRRKVALQAAIRPAVFERLVSHIEHVAENNLWFARMVILAYDGDLEAAHQAALQLERFAFAPQRAALALLRNDRLEFERIRDSRPADWDPIHTSRLLMLAPADQPTTGELLSTARQALDANPDDLHARLNWGIALYRDGKQAEARDQLEPLANSHLRGVVWPVLAMIHHQLGDESQARQWLQRSNDWLSWQHPGTSADVPRIFKPGVSSVEDWLVAAVFNQEARRLIDGAPRGATDEPAAPPASENNQEEDPETPEPE
jgi:tetratricopeptide (TPR) repeat protein